MSNIRVPISVPSALVNKSNYKIQFSLYHPETAGEIFIDMDYSPSDLTAGQNRTLIATFPHGNLPRFRQGGERELRAHFWKGQKLIETVDCGDV
jgi:hypothetical protein